MIFLTPIPAIIAAAVAAPALLVLYFLKLRRRPVRVGSTMLWRAAAEDLQANVPFKCLRPSLLLLLQLLILACLLLALARPAVNTDGQMPDRVFLIVDCSASMRAADMPEGATRFDRARQLARTTIERLGAGGARSEVTLIAAAAQAEIVAGPTRSAGELLRALDALAPRDQPGDLAAALRLAQALSAGDDPEAEQPPRTLTVVCSDGSTPDPLPAMPGQIRFERAAPEQAGANLGLVALAARRDHETPSLVRVFARVQSNLAEPATLGLAVSLDGQVVSREAIEAVGAGGDGPGQTPVALQVSVPGPGLLTVSLERADALASDDTASVILPEPRRPAVLLVREREDEAAGSGWLLTDVLRELDLSGLTLSSAERVATQGATAYEGIDLAIFDGVASPGVPPIPSLHFGRPPAVPGLSTTPSGSGVLAVLAWERSHPLLRDISLDAVRVGRGQLLSPTSAEDAAAFTDLARTAEGVVLASVEHLGVRHVITGFDLVQSTWPVDYSFPIFLANAVETLPRGGGSASGWSATTSAPASPPVVIKPGSVLRDPTGVERSTPGSSGPGTRLGVLDTVGLWRAGEVVIPVNLLDERESSLEAPGVLAAPGGDVARAGSGLGEGEPREAWPWFVMAAAVLLAVEWVVFAARARV